jgi:hypothetical protein
VDSASGDKLQELVPDLIARVETADRHVTRIVPTEGVKPFFAWAKQGETCVGVAPPDGLAGAGPAQADPLAWYAVS